MKILSLIIALTLALFDAKAQIITAAVTVTNPAGTANANTITVNGTTRNFTNFIQSYQNNILATNNIWGATSNLYLAYLISGVSGVYIQQPATNQVTFNNQLNALSVSISPGWATLTLFTNYITNSIPVRVPVSSVSIYDLTNMANGLRDFLNSSAVTNPFSSTAPAFAQFANLATIIAYAQANTNFTLQTSNNLKNFTLTIGANGTNNDTGVSNGIIAIMEGLNLNSITPSPDGPAFKAGDFFQPSNGILTQLIASYPFGIPANLSYYASVSVVGGWGNDIALLQTNHDGLPNNGPNYDPSGGDSIDRLDAFYGQAFNARYEDGKIFLAADTSHNVSVIDHANIVRAVYSDAGGNTWRGNGGQDGISESPDGQLNTLDPITANTAHWPIVGLGTATNFTSLTNFSTGETTVHAFHIPANTSTNVFDTMHRTIGITFSATGSYEVKVYFAGNLIFDDPVSVATAPAYMRIESDATVNAVNSFTSTTSGTGTSSILIPASFCQNGSGTPDFTTAVDCKLGVTGPATGNLTVILDNVVIAPSAAWQGIH